MNRNHLRRAAPLAVALAGGGGPGPAISAPSSGGPRSPSPATVAVATQPTAAHAATTDLEQLYKDVTPGVVDITVEENASSGGSFPFGGGGTSEAEGSGF